MKHLTLVDDTDGKRFSSCSITVPLAFNYISKWCDRDASREAVHDREHRYSVVRRLSSIVSLSSCPLSKSRYTRFNPSAFWYLQGPRLSLNLGLISDPYFQSTIRLLRRVHDCCWIRTPQVLIYFELLSDVNDSQSSPFFWKRMIRCWILHAG